jgi:hypothetical protein
MMNDGAEILVTLIALVILIVFPFILTVVLKLECSFLGISKWIYGIIGHFDCNGFLFRDWLVIWIWIIATIDAIVKLKSKNTGAYKILGLWVVAIIVGGLIEWALALMYAAIFLFIVLAIVFIIIFYPCAGYLENRFFGKSGGTSIDLLVHVLDTIEKKLKKIWVTNNNDETKPNILSGVQVMGEDLPAVNSRNSSGNTGTYVGGWSGGGGA